MRFSTVHNIKEDEFYFFSGNLLVLIIESFGLSDVMRVSLNEPLRVSYHNDIIYKN